jgi:hypothetical protein
MGSRYVVHTSSSCRPRDFINSQSINERASGRCFQKRLNSQSVRADIFHQARRAAETRGVVLGPRAYAVRRRRRWWSSSCRCRDFIDSQSINERASGRCFQKRLNSHSVRADIFHEARRAAVLPSACRRPQVGCHLCSSICVPRV